MKVNELLGTFHVFMNNEERELREQIDQPRSYDSFTEREQVVIDGMIRKSLVKRYRTHDTVMIRNNEKL